MDTLQLTLLLILSPVAHIARYRLGIVALVLTTGGIGAVLVLAEHVQGPSVTGVEDWAWIAAAAAVTVLHLPRIPGRFWRYPQSAVALVAAFLLMALGTWIS